MLNQKTKLILLFILAVSIALFGLSASYSDLVGQNPPPKQEKIIEEPPSGQEIIEDKYDQIGSKLTEEDDLPYAGIGREDPLSYGRH